MTNLEAQAKDYAMSRKLNLSEPTDITHVIGLLENAYIAGAKGVWHDLRKNPADLPGSWKGYLSEKVIINTGSVAYYDFGDGLWYDWNFDFEIEDEVIAWCAYPCYEGIEENSGN